MPFNSVRACPEDSKKLPLRGKTSPAPGQILPGRGEMSPQVTKRGTDVAPATKRGMGGIASAMTKGVSTDVTAAIGRVHIK
mgnify:CR=1 FL=1